MCELWRLVTISHLLHPPLSLKIFMLTVFRRQETQNTTVLDLIRHSQLQFSLITKVTDVKFSYFPVSVVGICSRVSAPLLAFNVSRLNFLGREGVQNKFLGICCSSARYSAHMPADMDSNLFNPSILEELDFSSVESSYEPKISILNPGEGLRLRPLKISDFDAGFTECLEQLTVIGKVDKEQFEDTFKRMKTLEGMYYIIVIEDECKNRIIASGTLLVEQKFIHSCALRGRIEDIVVDSAYRGKQLGKVLIHCLTLLSKSLPVYKVTLDCNDSKRGFYEKLGFIKEEGNSNYMQMRFS